MTIEQAVTTPAPGEIRSATGGPVASGLGQVSWAMFEWARNPYVILVVIYIFAPYFTSTVVGDPVRGQAIWGNINAVSGFFIAVLAPFLGAVADNGGRRKPWIAVYMAIMLPCMFALWFALPHGIDGGIPILAVAALIVTIAICFEFSAVFHNAMLPTIATHDRIGGLSGLGLALGNAGALLILIFMLYSWGLPANPEVTWGFLPETPLFGIDPAAHEHERIAGPIVAFWFVMFALPLMFFTPDLPRTDVRAIDAIRNGLRTVIRTVLKLKHFRNIAIYLAARMIYNDGKTAVLIFGGVYAVGIFGWDATTMMIYGIVLSTFAVFGGIFGGWLDDYLGSKRAILVSIGGTMVGMLGAVSMTPTSMFFFIPYDPESAEPLWTIPYFATLPELSYLLIVIIIAIFITAAYANSRTMMARIAPPAMMTEFFGLYALSGTATAFLAPATVSFFTSAFESQRIGFASILILLGIGFLGMFFVKEERARAIR